VAAIAAIASRATLTADFIEFTAESNIVTSGGYGPNQVSSVLALGAFLGLFLLWQSAADLKTRLLVGVAVGVFATQSALTFSRGGLINAAGAAVVAAFYLIRARGVRARVLQIGPVLFVAAAYLVLPRLDEFTGGQLSARYEETTTSHRWELLQADLRVWMENPIFGSGPGLAKPARLVSTEPAAAHTEFSRLLAEHGIFGLGALGLLVLMAAERMARARTPIAKGMVASMTGWSFLYMLHSGMRLAAPSVLFGLTFAQVAFRLAVAVEPSPPLGSAKGLAVQEVAP
jgi:hypothetical protein